MDIGQLIDPQPNPQPVQAAQAPAPGSDEHKSIFDGWMGWLQHPEVQAALLQFGASVLQPAGWGQSQAGRIGQAAGEAGQAVSRMTQQQQQAKELQSQEDARAAATANDTRRTDISAAELAQTGKYQEGQLGLQTKELDQRGEQNKAENTLAQARINADYAGQAQQAAAAAAQLAFARDQAKTDADYKVKSLELEKQKADAQQVYYTALANKTGKATSQLTPQEKIIATGLNKHMADWSAAFTMNDPEGRAPSAEEFGAEFGSAMDAALKGVAGAQGTAAPATSTPGGTGAATPSTATADLSQQGKTAADKRLDLTKVTYDTDQKAAVLPGGGRIQAFTTVKPADYLEALSGKTKVEVNAWWEIQRKAPWYTPEAEAQFRAQVAGIQANQAKGITGLDDLSTSTKKITTGGGIPGAGASGLPIP